MLFSGHDTVVGTWMLIHPGNEKLQQSLASLKFVQTCIGRCVQKKITTDCNRHCMRFVVLFRNYNALVTPAYCSSSVMRIHVSHTQLKAYETGDTVCPLCINIFIGSKDTLHQ